jgi:glutamine synthetase
VANCFERCVFIANWIDMKQKEYDALRLRPHPYDFAMYYDV